ncbi:hypothetical protein [Actinomadura sp. GTD37]|uniref:hypothetical protein n=1 Tax=Actinomadura sp. GTD37 TaxID=1778030 RepID=UPI0035C033D0
MPTINSISAQEGTNVPRRRTVPHANDAASPAEFLARMRRLQRWSGLSLAEIEARMATAPVLLPGGLSGLLGGSALPRRDVVSAFISACGCAPEVQAEWMHAYARVTASPQTPAPSAKPAVISEPAAEPVAETESRPEEPEQGKRPRPRHRKASGRRRSLSPLVAAPAFVTVAVIAVAMLTGTDGDSGKGGAGPKGGPSAAAPPETGWYAIQPETAVAVGNCLTILPDDRFAPTLSQDKCDDEDPLQRFWLETHPGRTYVIQARTVKEQLWCLTLDGPDDGARLHLTACDKGSEWQKFTLETAEIENATDAGPSEPAPLFDLRAAETRERGMCVGIDPAKAGTVHAVHTGCAKTAIWGYSLVPSQPPEGI